MRQFCNFSIVDWRMWPTIEMEKKKISGGAPSPGLQLWGSGRQKRVEPGKGGPVPFCPGPKGALKNGLAEFTPGAARGARGHIHPTSHEPVAFGKPWPSRGKGGGEVCSARRCRRATTCAQGAATAPGAPRCVGPRARSTRTRPQSPRRPAGRGTRLCHPSARNEPAARGGCGSPGHTAGDRAGSCGKPHDPVTVSRAQGGVWERAGTCSVTPRARGLVRSPRLARGRCFLVPWRPMREAAAWP